MKSTYAYGRGATSLGSGSKPGPNFWLMVNKKLAQGPTSLVFEKAQAQILEFCNY